MASILILTPVRKPSTTLTGPHPAPIIIPKFTLDDATADYESELTIIIGKDAKNVSEADALDYVLGYTAGNDVSSKWIPCRDLELNGKLIYELAGRTKQFEQSQWCYSKGFDTACPIGPAVISTRWCPDPSKLHMRGIKNGKVMQESGLR